MHSSRMRTGRSLTVCCSLLLGGGSPWSGGFSLLGGVLPAGGGSPWSQGGVCLVLGGLLGPGGVLPAGGSSPCWGGSPWSRGGVCLVWGGLLGPRGVCLVGGFSLVWGVLPARGWWCLPGPGGSPETPPRVQNHRHV